MSDLDLGYRICQIVPHGTIFSKRRVVNKGPRQPPRMPRLGSAIVELQQTALPRNGHLGPGANRPLRGPIFFTSQHRKRRDPTESPQLISRSQVAVYEKKMRCTRVGDGLVRVAHGWYATRRLGDWEKVRALMAILPEDAVVAGETAGLLYGVDVRSTSAHNQPFRLCVSRPAGQRAIRRPGIRCRVLQFEKGDRIRRHGIRCTSPLRTALDIAAGSTVELATHVFEIFLRRRLVTFSQLRERIRALTGQRGVVVLRRALQLAKPKSESVFETAVRIRLIEAGLDAPEPQIPVQIPGRAHPVRLDLGWVRVNARDVKLGVECDSDKHHPTSGPKAVADRQRRRSIERQGWRVISVRYSALYGSELTFEHEIADALGVTLAQEKRENWWLSRWVLRRNAWTRSNKKRDRAA